MKLAPFIDIKSFANDIHIWVELDNAIL